MPLRLGDIIDGKYRMIRLLGQGGMGAVYEGERLAGGQRVAIKVLHGSVASKRELVQRFEREAQAAARIGSEHIAEVLELGSLDSGERYMVMELLQGETLGARLARRHRMAVREIAPIIGQALDALAEAHALGIIHRDLKPENLFLVTRPEGGDFVKVLDFGVSKFSELDGVGFEITRNGGVMGTPYYLSPEQARGAGVDQRTDIYSLGVVLYEAVSGRLPFEGRTFNELVFRIALEAAAPLESVAPGLDPSFAAVIRRAMARDLTQRLQSAREFRAALAPWIARASLLPLPPPLPAPAMPTAAPRPRPHRAAPLRGLGVDVDLRHTGTLPRVIPPPRRESSVVSLPPDDPDTGEAFTTSTSSGGSLAPTSLSEPPSARASIPPPALLDPTSGAPRRPGHSRAARAAAGLVGAALAAAAAVGAFRVVAPERYGALARSAEDRGPAALGEPASTATTPSVPVPVVSGVAPEHATAADGAAPALAPRDANRDIDDAPTPAVSDVTAPDVTILAPSSSPSTSPASSPSWSPASSPRSRSRSRAEEAASATASASAAAPAPRRRVITGDL